MSSMVVRALVVLVLIGLAVIVASLARRWQRPIHVTPALVGLNMPPGLVVFTATDCSKCRDALALAAQTGAPIREVTYELEPAAFERAGVEAVPLTAVVNGDGSVVATFVGIPRSRRLRRALSTAGF